MKRILLVLVVALVMAATLIVLAMPAFAAKEPAGRPGSCGVGTGFTTTGHGATVTHHCR